MPFEKYNRSSLSALSCVTSGLAYVQNTVRMTGSRFEIEVPRDWKPGYRDIDEKLLMIYFSDDRSGATLEGVYLRKVQPAGFTLADFRNWRMETEGKHYTGKAHKLVRDGTLVIAGESGNYLQTSWREGGMEFEKHTAQYLKAGRQYMVVLHGRSGQVDKRVFDHAVSSFAPCSG